MKQKLVIIYVEVFTLILVFTHLKNTFCASRRFSWNMTCLNQIWTAFQVINLQSLKPKGAQKPDFLRCFCMHFICWHICQLILKGYTVKLISANIASMASRLIKELTCRRRRPICLSPRVSATEKQF